jgi:hypothetical protein
VLLFGGLVYYDYSSMNARIAQLQQQTKDLEAAETTANKTIADAELLDAWNAGDVIWLDELRNLSKKYPPAEEAIINRFVAAGLQREAGGRYFIDCAAVSPETITKIENLLRDKRHDVQGGGGSTEDDNQQYNWVFKKMVTVTPPSDEPVSEEAGEEESGGKPGGESTAETAAQTGEDVAGGRS